jgi:hypothetical protein
MSRKSAVEQRVVRQSPTGNDVSTEAEEDTVSSCYLATISEQTEDFMYAVVGVIYNVYEFVRML